MMARVTSLPPNLLIFPAPRRGPTTDSVRLGSFLRVNRASAWPRYGGRCRRFIGLEGTTENFLCWSAGRAVHGSRGIVLSERRPRAAPRLRAIHLSLNQ